MQIISRHITYNNVKRTIREEHDIMLCRGRFSQLEAVEIRLKKIKHCTNADEDKGVGRHCNTSAVLLVAARGDTSFHMADPEYRPRYGSAVIHEKHNFERVSLK